MIKRAPTVYDYLLLAGLSAMFGASFMFTSVALRDLPPLIVVFARLFVALVVFLPIMLLLRQAMPRGSVLRIIWACALFGNALPFLLISWAQQKVDAGLTAIFMAIMPLATVALAHWFTADEKLNGLKLTGVIAGLLGVVVLMTPMSFVQSLMQLLTGLWSEQPLAEVQLYSGATTAGSVDGTANKENLFDSIFMRQLAVIAATLCYAVNAILTRQLAKLPRYSLMSTLMLFSLLMLLPVLAVITLQGGLPVFEVSLPALLAVLVLGLGPTALATLMILVIIDRQGASFLSQINFMVPLFGVLFGALFLSERLPLNAWPALVFILLGIYLTRRGALANL